MNEAEELKLFDSFVSDVDENIFCTLRRNVLFVLGKSVRFVGIHAFARIFCFGRKCVLCSNLRCRASLINRAIEEDKGFHKKMCFEKII
jgi:hypothetical protein